ncbi:MAG: hypothetical protein WA110_00140 [Anaerolineaceae bacterium]
MKNKFVYLTLTIIFVFGAVLPNGVQPASAQTPEPPKPPEEPALREPCVQGEPCQDADGNWYMPAGSMPEEDTTNELLSIGDMDDYGYTLSSTTYSWVDITNGTNTEIDDTYDITDPIALPFSFPFYENIYPQIYITGAGYLTFDNGNVDSAGEIPNESYPNNVVAPYWNYQYYPTGQVFYKSFGTYFVVQWNQLQDYEGYEYTFQTILYQNGDIKFQYNTVRNPDNNGYYCSTSGIEDSYGLDGLTYWNRCDWPTNSYSAVLFTRPGVSARLRVSPLYQGEFSYSDDMDEFTFTVENNGDLGEDVYDMVVTIVPLGSLWTATLHDPATGDLLIDTDGDSVIDTGSLAQGEARGIMVRVTAPNGLSLGSAVKTLVDISSSLDTYKTKTATLESTAPASFAQTYRINSQGQVNMDLNWTSIQQNVKVSPGWDNVYDPVVVETADNGFINAWLMRNQRDDDGYNGYTLNYSKTDHFGQLTYPVTVLTSLYAEPGAYTYIDYQSLAAAPDGKFGIAWVRYIDSPTKQFNFNVWFAVLNPSGSLEYGPVNLTNNSSWGDWYAVNNPHFSYLNIASTADNRFMVTWEKYVNQGTSAQADVYYTICQSSGAAVVPATKMTDSLNEYKVPTVTGLSNNRYFVTYYQHYCDASYCYSDSKYRVYDSSGSLLVPESDLSFNNFTNGVQLSGGNILFVTEWDTGIKYSILNGNNYATIFTSDELTHPSNSTHAYGPSVTKDSANHGVITWSDGNGKYLYYALVLGSNGALLSGPVVFNHFGDGMNINYDGYSTTTNSWQPDEGLDLMTEFSGPLYGAVPGGLAGLRVHYLNQGLTTGTNPVLSLTLADGLSYIYDTSGLTPSVVGNTITWHLPDLAFSDAGNFIVYVSVPSEAPISTLYDVNLSIASNESDVNPADNVDTAQVMAAVLIYLPFTIR